MNGSSIYPTASRQPRGHGTHVILAGVLACTATAAIAQGTPPSLIQNPQQGATPRPLPTAAPRIGPAFSNILPYTPPPMPAPTRLTPPAPLPAPAIVSAPVAAPAAPPMGLPAPTDDPLRIDPATDPILRLSQEQVPLAIFHRAIATAVGASPTVDEARAQSDEARAARNEARTKQYPVADLALTRFQVVSRAFSDDPTSVLERARPRERTDATLRIQIPLIDFGANGGRIRAGNDRIQAAIAGIEDTRSQVALQAISAWYNVYGYRVLVRLGDTFAASQRSLRGEIEARIAQRVAAPADVAQIDGYIASSEAQLADFRRSLANAEAQYTALIGSPPPPTLGRAPAPDLSGLARDRIATDAAATPRVRVAQATAEAARRDAGAQRADLYPQLTGGLDAGRYGVIETSRDYDVRANLTLGMRLGGGGRQRVDQAVARASGADARYRQTRDDAQRDAAIAWSDVTALEDSRQAIEANYLASRRSRDVLAERFRVARGTLFDVLAADSNYFSVAARYVQTLTELDTARYVLLARTGKLLGTLGIAPATVDQP